MKKLLSLLLALSMVFCLFSCGEENFYDDDDKRVVGRHDDDKRVVGRHDDNKPSDEGTTAPSNEGTTAPTEDGTESAIPEQTEPLLVVYTVTVVDSLGQPISDVKVQLCNETSCYLPKATDENGVIIFEQYPDDYKAMVTQMPAGYSMSQEYFYFAEGSYEMTIVLSST